MTVTAVPLATVVPDWVEVTVRVGRPAGLVSKRVPDSPVNEPAVGVLTIGAGVLAVRLGGLRSTPKLAEEAAVMFPALSEAWTLRVWFPSARPERVAVQVPEVLAPAEVSDQEALVQAPLSSWYWTELTPEAPVPGSVAVPETE